MRPANCPLPTPARVPRSGFIGLAAALLLAGCAGLVDKPAQRTLYDFGPGASPAVAATARQPSLVLAEVEATGGLEGSAVLYRLGYVDAHQLRPYAHARWTAPPAQLVRKRLRDQLGRDRVVLSEGEGAALAREGGNLPRVLRLELDEFAQYFESADRSFGRARLRATLLDNTPGGERLLAQRSFELQLPATTPDAPGGVRALAAATDALASDLAQWLAQAGTRAP